MPNTSPKSFIAEPPGGETILAALRMWMPGTSWSAARKLLAARRVLVNDVLCVDEARRIAAGDRVTLVDQPLPSPPGPEQVTIRFVDREIVIVEKPAGMLTLRRPEERSWPLERRKLQPTLDEAVALRIAQHAAHKAKRKVGSRQPKLLAVHRLDRDTSGLVVFARTSAAQADLIAQFARREATRKYLAIVRGTVASQTIHTRLVRDRGDGLRGSTPVADGGQVAVTHVRRLRKFEGHCELECRLETGRTNQIRIHLAELGHPVCGDRKYRGPVGSEPQLHKCGSPRLMLHATELRVVHPASGESLAFNSPWPPDAEAFLDRYLLPMQ